MNTVRDAAQVLFTLAEQADARFSATVAERSGGKRDRWTMTADDLMSHEVREAYRAKITADEAWLTFLRTSRKAS